MTNTSGELGGIVGGLPVFPYARLAGMISSRRPPTFIPGMPCTQPRIKLPVLSAVVNG